MHKIPPGTHPLAAELMGVLVPLFKGSQPAVAAAMAGFDLTFSQMRILFVLDSGGVGLPVNALAEAVSLSLPAAGRAVDGLVRQGLVSRTEDAADRRIKRIELTDAGRQTLDSVAQARSQSADRFVESLSDDEKNTLAGALKTLGTLTRKYFGDHAGTACSPKEKPE